MERKKALRNKRGQLKVNKDVNKVRKKKLKKRATYRYAKKLRDEAKKTNAQNNSSNKETNSQTDESSGIITKSAVLSGRNAIYQSKRYSNSFREKESFKLDSKDSANNPFRFDGSINSNSKPPPTNGANENKQKMHRMYQKSRNKRDYARSFKKSQEGLISMPWEKGSSIFKKASKEGQAARIFKVLFNNKGKIGVALIILLIVVTIVTIVYFIGMLLAGLTSIIGFTTYPSTDEDINETEEAYIKLEDALNKQINNMESTHPGFDEYRYQVDEISHNPYELISYFTVKYGEFTYEDIEDEIKELFNRQYILRVWSETYGEGENKKNVLNISLTNRGIRALALEDFTKEKVELFDTYTTLHGNRDGIFKNTVIPADVDHYKIPPEALSDERFRNVISEAEKYLGYPYVWGGSNPSTSFDCSGFVCYVINNCNNGWNVGRVTAEDLRHMTTFVRPEEARPGDIVYFKGTYNTAGASHVGIYVGDGMMIHCGNPIQYASINTSYWQQHFFEFGRLP